MVSGPGASLYPFFDLHNVPIKAVKTDLPFIVSFFFEYPYYRKIGGPALGHRWELQPGVPDRTQFQEVSALFPRQYRAQYAQTVVGQTGVVDAWHGSLSLGQVCLA